MVVDAGSILELFGVRTKKKAKDRAQWVTRFTVEISTDNTVWSSVDGGSIVKLALCAKQGRRSCDIIPQQQLSRIRGPGMSAN